MFTSPSTATVHTFFKGIAEVETLHAGEGFNQRLEAEIALHQGQIHAENLLLNTIARYRDVALANGLTRNSFNKMVRDARYDLTVLRKQMVSIANGMDLDQLPEDGAINTADLMRQRAAMLGAVMSSTPILLRDPWGGQPVTGEIRVRRCKSRGWQDRVQCDCNAPLQRNPVSFRGNEARTRRFRGP